MGGSAGASGRGGSSVGDGGGDCYDGVIRCDGRAQAARSVCVDGAWKFVQPCPDGELCDSTTGDCEPLDAGTRCSDTDGGCVEEVCSPGRYSCGPDGSSDLCDSSGVLRDDDECTAPDRLCNKATGRCEDNAAFPLGRWAPSGLSGNFSDDLGFYATPILVTENVHLRRIGIRTTSASSAGRAFLALYENTVINGMNRPGARVTYTDALDLVVGGTRSQRPNNYGRQLDAGQLYWAAALVTGTNVRIDESVGTVSYDGASLSYVVSAASWATPLPAFPSAVPLAPGHELGIYIEAQRFWQP